jgi:diaminopimelate epimerase
MNTVRLAKLHATGNDFLVWSRLERTAPVPESFGAQAAALCDRRRGIGADGVIVVLAPDDPGADCRMLLFNADGTIAEMSGNGIRCLAWVARREGCGTDDRLVVDTGGGRRVVELELDTAGDVVQATVDMGPVAVEAARRAVEIDGTRYEGAVAHVGNPHFVLFVDDPARAPLTTHGPRIERDASFPDRTNVEFVAVTGPDEVTMRVWERGVGETLSCGTGASATAVVAHRAQRVGNRVTVRVPGGDLLVEVGETVRLGGPVQHVFDVDIDVDELARSRA